MLFLSSEWPHCPETCTHAQSPRQSEQRCWRRKTLLICAAATTTTTTATVRIVHRLSGQWGIAWVGTLLGAHKGAVEAAHIDLCTWMCMHAQALRVKRPFVGGRGAGW